MVFFIVLFGVVFCCLWLFFCSLRRGLVVFARLGGVGRFSVVGACCRSGGLFASPFGGSVGWSPCGGHRFFSPFLSMISGFFSTFGGFFSIYSCVFPCISQIFFVTLYYQT